MGQQILNNGEEKGIFRRKLNENFGELYGDTHTHNNKSTLDKFGESAGQPTFNGTPIEGKPGTPGADGAPGRDATINGKNVLEIIDSETVVTEIANGQMQFHATGTAPYVLYLARKNGNAVFTQEKPTENQVIIDRTWRPVTWGEWTEITTIEFDADLLYQEAELIIGNLVTAKLWLNSDITIPNAQFKLTIVDKADGTELADAFATVDLNNISTILTPATFINKFRVSRKVPISQLRITLSVMVLASAVQFGVVSNIPAQVSFATITAAASGGGGSGDMLVEVYDPQGKKTDIFAYIDGKFAGIVVDETLAVRLAGA